MNFQYNMPISLFHRTRFQEQGQNLVLNLLESKLGHVNSNKSIDQIQQKVIMLIAINILNLHELKLAYYQIDKKKQNKFILIWHKINKKLNLGGKKKKARKLNIP